MQTVACFGDSLIYGFPFGPRISWLAEAEKLTGDMFEKGEGKDDSAYHRVKVLLKEYQTMEKERQEQTSSEFTV